MKIKNLIAQLKKLDENKEIYIKLHDSNYFSEFEMSDAFDNTSFSVYNENFDVFIPCENGTADSVEHYVISLDSNE